MSDLLKMAELGSTPMALGLFAFLTVYSLPKTIKLVHDLFMMIFAELKSQREDHLKFMEESDRRWHETFKDFGDKK